MKYAFHPEARLEYLEAAAFYNAVRPGLGAAFTVEIEAAIELICHAANRWPKFEQDVRRCLIRQRFPYAILYTIEDDYILLVAVMHCSRQPGYWKHRLN